MPVNIHYINRGKGTAIGPMWRSHFMVMDKVMNRQGEDAFFDKLLKDAPYDLPNDITTETDPEQTGYFTIWLPNARILARKYGAKTMYCT
jgi:hypothetical protein